jgi:hypothetical protein
MKFYLQLLLFLTIVFGACQSQKESADHNHDSTANKETIQPDTIKKSIPKEEHAQIGDAHITIKYHAPAVRGRTIWGGLVSYGEVWVTGAHSATSFEINNDFVVDGKEIPAGKYAIFTIPDENKWTFIINKNWKQHLADDYDAKDDVARIEVTPEQLQTTQERLKYTVSSESANKGSISVSWEKIKVSLPFELK